MTIPSEALKKVCTKCGQSKHAEKEFYSRGDGTRQAQCIDCHKLRTHDNRQARLLTARAQEREYMLWRRLVIKEAVFQAYGGWQCACCGETERLFLTLDHVENNGAEERRKISGKRTSAGYQTYTVLFRQDFPSGYQVLCMNCQHGKRMNQGICPHQGTCNDHGSDASRDKRLEAPGSSNVQEDDEMVCSALKDAAALLRRRVRKSRAA